MHIKEKYIKKYQTIYKKIYNERITYEEAYTQCMDLVLFCTVATKPFTKEDLKALEKKK